MLNSDYDKLLQIIALLKLDYGNILHLAVLMRDHSYFIENQTTPLLYQKHNGKTPLDLAQSLGYCEFYHNEKRTASYEVDDGTVFEGHLDKYLNIFKQYRKRKIKMTVNNLISYASKITVVDLQKCSVFKDLNKIIIKTASTALYFKSKDEAEIRHVYNLLIDKNKRIEIAKNSHHLIPIKGYNANYYSLLCKFLLSSNNTLNSLYEDLRLSTHTDCMNVIQGCTPLFRIYRNALPVISSYAYEPISYLQKLCEPFHNIHLIELENPLAIFRSVITFSIASYALLKNRRLDCFKALIEETFVLKNDAFKIFVERSSPNIINLLFKYGDMVFIQCNNHVEARIGNYIIIYESDLRRIKHANVDHTQIINMIIPFTMYSVADVTDENILCNKDDFSQGFFEDSIIEEKYFLNSKDQLNKYIKIYTGSAQYKNETVCGSIKYLLTDLNGSKSVSSGSEKTIETFKGSWSSKLVFTSCLDNKITKEVELNFKTFPAYYNFNLFTMQLNFPEEALGSDSRMREDIRLLENGEIDECREANEILKNRERIKVMQRQEYLGRMFILENDIWVFTNKDIEDNISFIL